VISKQIKINIHVEQQSGKAESEEHGPSGGTSEPPGRDQCEESGHSTDQPEALVALGGKT